jgi:uncharacterized cupin superfamily protein
MRRINISARFEYDPEDPEGFHSGMLRCGPLVGADQLGASVYELPPGQAICPYHYEYPEEEWLLVLEGRPTLRHPDGADPLEPWDLVCFPTGPRRRPWSVQRERGHRARADVLHRPPPGRHGVSR